LQEPSGYFQFGPSVICYGQTISNPSATVHKHLWDASQHIGNQDRAVVLPFDLTQVVDNLRYEHYVKQSSQDWVLENHWTKKAYYLLRPLLPTCLRRHLQKLALRGWDTIPFPRWPVDRSVDLLFERLLVLTMHTLNLDRVPFIWFWPEGHTACAIITHDVETAAGRDFTGRLMDIDEAFGVKASFQIVPEQRYSVSPAYLDAIRERGFEICVQGLNHDGRLFGNYAAFLRCAQKINHYAEQFGAQGFRSPILYRKVDWFKALSFSYDMSMPNVAHLEPQRGGCCTVMPYFLPDGMLELPLTTTQDYSLFHILEEYSLALWKQQIRIILDGHGLMSFLIHPDYVIQKRAQDIYKALLDYVNRLRSEHRVWVALPREVDCWWRERSGMQLVADNAGWRITGLGSDRARLAYARLDSDRLVYEIYAPRSSEMRPMQELQSSEASGRTRHL
jgi:peptidoglycan/xylan/chitin deacetylase (PgdA/CDA1 family)